MTADTENDFPDDGLRRAAAASVADVDSMKLIGEDRSIVLKALLNARLGDFAEIPASSRRGASAVKVASSPGPAEPVAEGDVLGMIGRALKVDRETLEFVYDIDDGEPIVVVSAKKIAPNKSAAARQLGQLIAAARQGAGLEEWTSATTIRSVVSHYGRLDGNNFAASLQQMDSVAVIKGKGLQREIKITRPGFESTADMIRSLAGTE